MNITALIVVCFLAFSAALPNQPKWPKHRKGGTRKDSKQNEDDDNQTDLPLAFAEYYDYYNYEYDYFNWHDCNGDICVYGTEYLDVEQTIELENSSLEITEEKWLTVNTSSLWTECAPSVPLVGRLATFKSCHKWAEDNNNVFDYWYARDVCNYRNRMWLAQNGEIDTAKVEDMYNELENFKEYLDSCIQWDGEWPDYYDDWYDDYYEYDYDYRAEDVNKKNGKQVKSTKNKNKFFSGNKSKTKDTKRNKDKARKRNKNGTKKWNKNENKKRNKNEKKKRNKNENRKRKTNVNKKGNKTGNKKRNENGTKKRNKKRKNKNKNNNGMRYKREAKKDNNKKKENNKEKKKKNKKKKQTRALKVIDLSALPTEQTVERLRCIDASLSKLLDQCGENILKNQFP